ncbi:MAG: cyclase family protein [Cytophagales bacterium]|nr:cyclase family protein [Cytophagales bacterium]
MKIQFVHHGPGYEADLAKPIDISIPVRSGGENPNCYYSKDIKFEPVRSGDFVGDTREGGVVNHKEIFITPHGNGTHTECFGHISSAADGTINQCLRTFHFMAQLITLTPRKMENGDRVITLADYEKLPYLGTEAVIVRTIPNGRDKLTRNYSGTNPPFFEPAITQLMRSRGVKHVLVDLPSVDKEVDGGALGAHRNFWGFPGELSKSSTITELVYVDDTIVDGLYLLNLQIASLELDVSMSKPVLFKLERV